MKDVILVLYICRDLIFSFDFGIFKVIYFLRYIYLFFLAYILYNYFFFYDKLSDIFVDFEYNFF